MSVDFSKALSDRLGQLAQSQLQAALDTFDLGQLIDVNLATEGLFGQNLFLEVDGSGGREQWVFRGAPHGPYQFSRERYFVESVQRMTDAPVPWPFHVERDESLFGWSYALMPRLAGVPPSVVRNSVGEDEWCDLARQIGAGLAEMHGASTGACGEYDPESDAIAPEPSYEDWWMRSVERYRSNCLAIPDALDKKDVAYIDGLLADHRHALSVPFQPCVVHHDFKEGNIHVNRGAGGWEVSGIFDWMTAALGDAEQDLSRMASSLGIAGSNAVGTFLDAYQGRRPLREGARDRFRLYMLLDRLWIWQYARRNQVWFPKEAPHGSHKDELSFYLTEGSLSEPQPKPKSPLISPILGQFVVSVRSAAGIPIASWLPWGVVGAPRPRADIVPSISSVFPIAGQGARPRDPPRYVPRCAR